MGAGVQSLDPPRGKSIDKEAAEDGSPASVRVFGALASDMTLQTSLATDQGEMDIPCISALGLIADHLRSRSSPSKTEGPPFRQLNRMIISVASSHGSGGDQCGAKPLG